MTPEWEKLSSYKQVRSRTEMYFCSRDSHTQSVLGYSTHGPVIQEATWVPAVFTCFREILDNALDEIVTHHRGDRIDVTYDVENMIFTVSDNGRGIPIDWSAEHQSHAATVLLSMMNSGRNFRDDRGEARGLNGIGAKGVNYCSEWFEVLIQRDGTMFEQRFREGDELIVEDPIILPAGKKTGTTIKFKPSKHVFPNMLLPEQFVAARMYEISLCYPNLRLTYNGRDMRSKNGSLFGNQKPITFDIIADDFKSRFWLLPDSHSEEFTFSLVNAIPLFNGGTHIDAFRRGFYNGLLNALERESKRRKLVPTRGDIADGLLIYNITEMPGATFDSQSKMRLINENVGAVLRSSFDPAFFKKIIRDNTEWIDGIYQRCQVRTSAKDGKTVAREGRKNLRQKVEALKDACGHDRSKCILFLAEGDSAISGLIKARDPDIHGGLPLRGKLLNVFAESHKKIVENEALSKIMNSIGLIPGQRANRHALRYGKVYLTCDADHDGANITALLVNFFYQCWPELFDAERPPFIYVFNTPLIIAAKGKQRRYWYNDDYKEFDPNAHKSWDITRAKGLAALKQEDWVYILRHPQAVPLIDNGDLKEALTLLFDHSATDARKKWIGL